MTAAASPKRLVAPGAALATLHACDHLAASCRAMRVTELLPRVTPGIPQVPSIHGGGGAPVDCYDLSHQYRRPEPSDISWSVGSPAIATRVDWLQDAHVTACVRESCARRKWRRAASGGSMRRGGSPSERSGCAPCAAPPASTLRAIADVVCPRSAYHPIGGL